MLKELNQEADVEHRVINVLSDYFPTKRRTVEVDSRLVEDLYVDSIGLVEIVMALNEAFGVELAEDEVGEWRTVKDICASVNGSIG